MIIHPALKSSLDDTAWMIHWLDLEMGDDYYIYNSL